MIVNNKKKRIIDNICPKKLKNNLNLTEKSFSEKKSDFSFNFFPSKTLNFFQNNKIIDFTENLKENIKKIEEKIEIELNIKTQIENSLKIIHSDNVYFILKCIKFNYKLKIGLKKQDDILHKIISKFDLKFGKLPEREKTAKNQKVCIFTD